MTAPINLEPALWWVYEYPQESGRLETKEPKNLPDNCTSVPLVTKMQAEGYARDKAKQSLEGLKGEDVAELFWNLSSGEQAKFFNHLGTITSGNLPSQLSAIVNEDVLNICGMIVMSAIGNYEV